MNTITQPVSCFTDILFSDRWTAKFVIILICKSKFFSECTKTSLKVFVLINLSPHLILTTLTISYVSYVVVHSFTLQLSLYKKSNTKYFNAYLFEV